MDPCVRLLHRARSVIVKQGWARKTMKDDIGRRCILGALRDAAVEMKFPIDPAGEDLAYASAYLISAIETYYQTSQLGSGYLISEWNDKVCSGKHEAISLFDTAISIAEQRN